MPALALTGADRKRLAGDLPRFRLRNLFVEPDPSNTIDGVARLQRPGIETWLTVGAGPINAVFQQDGTFSGDYFVLSGTQVLRVTATGVATPIGTASDERAQIVATTNRLLLVNGGFAYNYDGTTWRQIIMPDGLPVQSVAYLAGFFLLTVRGSGRAYFMEIGESNPDPLNFFEAERLPDAIITAAVNGDELWLIGVQSEEIWVPSGDADAPFERVAARAYENGCINRDTLVQVDTTLIWVSNDRNVMMARGVPEPISPPDIAEAMRLATAASMRAWFFRLDSHVFYVITTDRDTYAYDLSRGEWLRFCGFNRDTWRAHLGAGMVAGDDATGALYRLVPGRSNDAGEPMQREITGGLEVIGAPGRCDSVTLRTSVGNTDSLTAAPRVELRWSDNEGKTWTDWRARELGLQGQYRASAVWRKLGLMRRPGRLFQFRAVDDVEFRISHAVYNEAVN